VLLLKMREHKGFVYVCLKDQNDFQFSKCIIRK